MRPVHTIEHAKNGAITLPLTQWQTLSAPQSQVASSALPVLVIGRPLTGRFEDSAQAASDVLGRVQELTNREQSPITSRENLTNDFPVF